MHVNQGKRLNSTSLKSTEVSRFRGTLNYSESLAYIVFLRSWERQK